MKRYVGFILIVLLVFSIFIACSKEPKEETDERELNDAELISEAVMLMTGDIGEYDDYVGEAAKSRMEPPWPWEGPLEFETPDGEMGEWYFWKLAFSDSIGQDTLLFLLMQTPDRWGDTTVPFVTNVEVWFLRKVHTNFWFHFEVIMDSLDLHHVSGMWKWYYEETWLEFEYTEMGVDSGDWSGTIDATTSPNISLTGHFEFDVDGSGTGYGRFQEIEFVRFTFYPMPADPYRGYFTLASEGWNVEHEFLPKQ
jgi:hypothetical protein